MIKYLDETYRKECRNNLVYFLYDLLNQTKYPNDIIAFMIKAWHFTFVYMAIFVFLFAPIWMGIILTFILLFLLAVYIYLKGCFVSHLEYKLCKKDFINIIDPYLIAMNYDITNENRYIGTIIIVVLYFCLILPILFYRINLKN
jgi:hypothetical protein